MVYIVAKCEDGICRPVAKKSPKCDSSGKGDAKKPKQLSAYNYFMKHYYAKMRHDKCFSQLSFEDKSAQAVRKWNALDDCQKAAYGKRTTCDEKESTRKRACNDESSDKLVNEIIRMVKLTRGRSCEAKDKLHEDDFKHLSKRNFVQLLRVMENANKQRRRECDEDMSELDSEDEPSGESESESDDYASEEERRYRSHRNPCKKRRPVDKVDDIRSLTRRV